MMTVYQSPNWDIFWHENSKCLHFVFKEHTKQLQSDEYLQELTHYIQLIKQYQPRNIYADTREFYFTITPDIQEFTNQNILSLYESIGIEKHAVLLSKDFFTAVSVEQTMEENQKSTYQNNYFDNEEALKKWLGF